MTVFERNMDVQPGLFGQHFSKWSNRHEEFPDTIDLSGMPYNPEIKVRPTYNYKVPTMMHIIFELPSHLYNMEQYRIPNTNRFLAEIVMDMDLNTNQLYNPGVPVVVDTHGKLIYADEYNIIFPPWVMRIAKNEIIKFRRNH